MTIVTKYAMLALLSASFIALNNCGSTDVESTTERSVVQDQSVSASDYAILGLPWGYPNLLGFGLGFGPLVPVEINCNDGTDDDGDGWPDCMDPDCHVHPECSAWGPPLEEVVNGRALTVYPNGIVVPEEVALLNARGADDDDAHGWQRDNFFATKQKDCWIDPKYQDPYYSIPLGEPLIVGPFGPIGPQLAPNPAAFNWFGPRAGLIEECEFGTDLMTHHMDDDNGAGAGAAGDTDDDDGGIRDDE